MLHPGSDDGLGFVSTVWTGDEGGVQFVLAAEQEKNQASQPLPIGKPGQLVFIVSGAQLGSQVPYRGTTATTTPLDGGSLVPPSGNASYTVLSAVGGLLNVIGGACQAAVGVNVVIAASAATVATEGGASPLTVPIAIGGSVVVVHGLDQVWAGVTTIYTGQTQRPYAAQALDPLTGNETASDLANAGVGIVFSLGAGAYANGAQIAGQAVPSSLTFAIQMSQLQKKWKHAADFGISTLKQNPATLAEFGQAVASHLNAARTIKHGTYLYVPESSFFFNPVTNIVVVLDKLGNFVTGWKLLPGTPQFVKFMNDGVLR